MTTMTSVADDQQQSSGIAEQQDLAWREFNIHHQSNNSKAEKDDNDAEDEDEGTPYAVNLFEAEPDFETYEFTYPAVVSDNDTNDNNEMITLRIRGQEEEGVSTGLGLWSGSQVLCDYLVHNDIAKARIQGAASVLELGAGLGLCGICCHRVLRAPQVWITDGDQRVLETLRYNVAQNRLPPSETDNHQVACPQLIWGNMELIEAFVQRHGRQPVLIASDVIYLTQSLEPFWKTVDALLVQKHDTDKKDDDETDLSNSHDNDKNGVLFYVNKSTSQAPVDVVLAMAQKYGFTWSHNAETDDLEHMRNAVFTFWRR